MADKISKPNVEKIKEILDKNNTKDEIIYINNKNTKYLAMNSLEFAMKNADEKIKYVTNSILTKTQLNAKHIEFINIIIRNLKNKSANIFIIDDIIDLLIVNNSLRKDKEKFWKNINMLDKLGLNEEKFTMEELNLMCANFVNLVNEKYLFKQTDILNYNIKYEYENVYNKRIEFYKNIANEYKTKYYTIIGESKWKFPNLSFQRKIKRIFKEISNRVYALKFAIAKNKIGKAYGISKCILKYINWRKDDINRKTGFMEMSVNDDTIGINNQKQNGDKEDKSLDKLILELDENTREKFISLDKETQKIIENNTFNKSTDEKSIKNILISNINKFYAEINPNENFSDEENDFGNFIGNNPNIIITNLDDKNA